MTKQQIIKWQWQICPRDINILIQQQQQQLLMSGIKVFSKDIRKKKTSEEQKQGNFKLKILSGKNMCPHSCSSSVDQDGKRIRFNTDYEDYDQTDIANKMNYNTLQSQQYSNRTRGNFRYQLSNKLSSPYAAHSTKHKNDLKEYFKIKGEDKVKFQKQHNINHPLFKFMEKKSIYGKFEKCSSKYQQSKLILYNSPYSPSIQKPRKSRSKRQKIILPMDNINLRNKKDKQIEEKNYLIQKQSYLQGEITRKEQFAKQQIANTIKLERSQQYDRVNSFLNESYGLTSKEQDKYGDRFPSGFEKIKLLGRGGFSLVWLGKHSKSGRQFAIKQIITNNTNQAHIKEIWFGTMFFTLGGIPKPQFKQSLGVKNLVRLYSYEINNQDTWIFYEKCGKSLGAALYDICSQKVYSHEKIYKIHFKPFYQAVAQNPKLLSNLVLEICRALSLLAQCKVVHSDIKTQNILIKFDEEGGQYQLKEVKLIDYGSAFDFKDISQFSMATPQYMPPEILNYIIHENQGEYQEQLYQQVIHNYKQSWSIDMWSLGCVVLQIVVGVPLWMSFPLLVPGKNETYLRKEGLFAVKGRLFPQIIAKQRNVIPQLLTILQQQNISNTIPSSTMKRIIIAMMDLNFNHRISPQEIIALLQNDIQ